MAGFSDLNMKDQVQEREREKRWGGEKWKEENVEMREYQCCSSKENYIFHFLGSFVCCFPNDKYERESEERME